MRLVSAGEAKEIDNRSQSEFGISGETLMEAAAVRSTTSIMQSYQPEIRSQSGITVFAGPGNSGGDGLAVARLLAAEGASKIRVVLVAPEQKRTELFKLQLERCRKSGIEILDALTESSILRKGLESSLLIDAIFGIGIKGEILEPYREVIEAINRSRKTVISLDTPSGLDVDRGVIQGVAIRATETHTYGLAKRGFFVNDGPSLIGKLKVMSIGFPPALVREIASSTRLVTGEIVAKLLPKRSNRSNKTNHGHALILAGSPGMWGAGVLAARAAYRVGAGYVTLASKGVGEGISLSRASEAPEILTADAMDPGIFKKHRFASLAIGPGFGADETTTQMLKNLKKKSSLNAVIDADALTVASEAGVFPLGKNWILTPHAGELSRIIDVESRVIESDRFRYVKEAAMATGAVVLLKGFRTLVSDGKKTAVIFSGNAALAKAGTGDVLTGLIAGLLAQGLSPFRAAVVAAYLHGRVADEWLADGNSKSSMMASDVIERLPELMGRLART